MTIVPQFCRFPVPGHPDWMASDDGHIYRPDGIRVPEYRKEFGENRLRVSCNAHGYHTVARLVWESFFGVLPPGLSVVHENGDLTDNRLANLRISESAGTHSNRAGKRRLLSEEQKGEIHRLLDAGNVKTRIAAALGISTRCVRYHATCCRCGRRPATEGLL